MLWNVRLVFCAFALGTGAFAQTETLNASEVCAAHPQVDAYGSLAWGENRLEGKSMPYDLTCPNMHIWTAGPTVMVKASTISQALAAFTEEAFLMSYFADLRVRYDGAGHLTADPVRDVGGSLLDDIFRIKVTVTPRGGAPHLLLQNAMPFPITLPPDQAFTLVFDTGDLPNPWPRIEIDPANGLVTALLGENF